MRRQFISFPKSGRTWLRYALTQAGVADQIAFHHDRFEYNDAARPALDFDFDRRLARYANAGKIVYLHRDPRDVMASLFAQVTGRFADIFQYRGSPGEFIRDAYFGAENLREFQRQWAELCRRGMALRVTYEDCHRNFSRVLGNVLDHYELHVDPTVLAQASAQAAFENMAVVERSGAFSAPWLRPRNGAPKVRVGRVGGYREAFSVEDRAYLDAVFGLTGATDDAAELG